ncbi:MAG: photosystem II oxygen evolving complex protein PsbP [Alkalinema sp. RU_4_3]|nr:photosystem II oxygen evolving complex protein PsbP [Alkalinema sp. RU_4_3]
MLKRFLSACLLVLTLGLQGCLGIGGLNSFIDDIDGYRFLYPNGWAEVQVSGGPDVVFHDIIEQTENISVVINPAPGKNSSPTSAPLGKWATNYRRVRSRPPDSGRTAELVNAASRDLSGKTYYILEYLVTLADGRQRHNLATASVSRGKLFTLNASTPEERWETMKPSIQKSISSFMVN